MNSDFLKKNKTTLGLALVAIVMLGMMIDFANLSAVLSGGMVLIIPVVIGAIAGVFGLMPGVKSAAERRAEKQKRESGES